MGGVTRRSLFKSGGLIGLAGVVGVSGCTRPAPAQPFTLERWRADRRAPYLIGHRGAGGVLPEHTLPSYLGALDRGAECIEISVVISSDGVLYCNHDLTLDRTTTMKGTTRQPSAALDSCRVQIPRLGPGWQGDRSPKLPRLQEVLEQVGRRAVLCIEPKDGSAYEPLVEMIHNFKLEDLTILKLNHSSRRIAEAKNAGFAVFSYLGNSDVATADKIRAAAGELDPNTDILVLPAFGEADLLAKDLVGVAVGTGVPTWVFPVHRRSEVAYFADLGVQGFVSADVGYLRSSEPMYTRDDWANERLRSGEITRSPYSEKYGLRWRDGGLSLSVQGQQAFVCLGSYCPLTSSSYRISFECRMLKPPADEREGISIAFCRADDSYYAHRQGRGSGYHGLLRMDGSLELFAHEDGSTAGELLASKKTDSLATADGWVGLSVEVTPDRIRFSRPGHTVEAADGSFRGGYFHIGRTSKDGELELRNLSIT